MKLSQLKVLQNVFIFSSLCLVLAANTACTRKASSSGAKIKMVLDSSFSKAGGSSKITVPNGFFPAHLIANVHYDGKTAVEEWDCNEFNGDDGDPTLCAFPTAIDFNGKEFPTGSNRIVQVLIVYGNEKNKLFFAYDDAVDIEFVSGDVHVNIGSDWLQQGGGTQGKVGGRHASFLSGRVKGYFQAPRAGRPPMELFDEYIFSGWFDFMFFEGVDLTYNHISIIDSGDETALFSEKSLGDFQSQLASDRAAVSLKVPAFYSVNQQNGDFDSDDKGGETIIVGFFGSSGNPIANSTAKSIQLPILNVTYDNVYRNIVSGSLLDPIDDNGDFLQVNGNSGGSEGAWSGKRLQFASGLDSSDTNSNDIVQNFGMGFYGSNVEACSTVSASNPVTAKCIKIMPELSADRATLPFEGPFEIIDGSNGGSLLENTTSTSVSWKFLPGVAGVSVDGLAIFLVNKDTNFRGDHPCHYMAEKAGISNLPTASASDDPVPAVYHKVEIPVAAANVSGSHDFGATDLNNKNALACPWKEVAGIKYFPSIAAENHGFYGGGPGPATKLKIEVLGNFSTINMDSCIPLKVNTVDDSDNEAFVSSNTTVNLDVDGTLASNVDFFDEADPACVGSQITDTTFDPDGSNKMLYVMATSSGISGNLNATTGSLTDASFAIADVTLNTAPLAFGTGVYLFAGSEQYKHNCQPIIIMGKDASGNPALFSGSPNVYVDDNGDSGEFYSDYSVCEADDMSGSGLASPFFAFTGNQASKMFFYRNNNSTDSANINLRAHDGGVSDVYDDIDVTARVPGVVDKSFTYVIKPETDSEFRTGFCYPLEIKLEDSNDKRTVAGTSRTITVTTDANAEVTTDSTCLSGRSSSESGMFTTPDTINSAIYIMPLLPNYTVNVSVAGIAGPETFNPPTADQTKLFVKVARSPFARSCSNGGARNIGFELQDSTGSSISGEVTTNKSYSTDVQVDLSFSDGSTYLSDGPSSGVCTNDYGGSNLYSLPSNQDSMYIDLQTGSSNSTDMTVTAPGMITDTKTISW